ncbi:MAG: hypothetical protein J6X53_01070, partial [Abditibacteriota bacterium]|nr:hypothetical protein [Abditibacteriota bacterium]
IPRARTVSADRRVLGNKTVNEFDMLNMGGVETVKNRGFLRANLTVSASVCRNRNEYSHKLPPP